MSDMVAVAAYMTPAEAESLRGALEAQGIFATAVGQMDFTYGLAPISQVLVREEDLKRARQIKDDALRK